jgi:hypothetical protein
VNNSGVYDPRHDGRVYSSGGDVLSSNSSCTRQVVNGVVRTVCNQYKPEKHRKFKKLKKDKDNDHDRDDRPERYRER